MSRTLPPGAYFWDDVRPGDHWVTGEATITAQLIDSFAELSGDRFDIHMDDTAARARGFSGRVAHGLLVLSLIDGLKNQADVQMRAIASLGWDWSFRAPVLIGDRISARITVDAARPTSNPARGILTLAFEVCAQSGEIVQQGTNQLMTERRPTPSSLPEISRG